ncbi:lysozyme inhibitor LprI family protein [Methylorubrum zatmanii]|uniref:Lysozyme inhibitor LprI family protein n=1 Tax=Methylorubrum zatmanii TaxID=29429 RepID=A0ABW1WHS1_9HYPH
MRSIVRIVVLGATAVVSIAHAEEDWLRRTPSAKETATIVSCLESALGADKQLACINLVARPCRGTQDGATTLGAGVCIDREVQIWDTLLNQNYRRLMAVLNDEGKNDLKTTQQTWLRFRNQACHWPYPAYQGGTFAGTLSGECFMTKTAIRTIDLVEMLDYLPR